MMFNVIYFLCTYAANTAPIMLLSKMNRASHCSILWTKDKLDATPPSALTMSFFQVICKHLPAREARSQSLQACKRESEGRASTQCHRPCVCVLKVPQQSRKCLGCKGMRRLSQFCQSLSLVKSFPCRVFLHPTSCQTAAKKSQYKLS